MELEIGNTRIFYCSICDVDTPHNIKANKEGSYGIMCMNCCSGAIVKEEELQAYQLKWEEELREILENLVEHSLEFNEDK